MLPSTCPRTSVGFSARPMSCAIQTRGTRIHPVSGSTSTSPTAAVYEYAGDGPTPPPLNCAAGFGGVYEPVVPSVPNCASAMQTASWNETPVDGFDASKTRRSANVSRSGGTPSRRDTAPAIRSRARVAASTAALPIISVTRLEYEPRSTGVRSVSPVTARMSNGSMPSTSATQATSTSSDPWPISVAPLNAVTPPLRSSLSWTPECGKSFQLIGRPAPDRYDEHARPTPRPRGSLRNLFFQSDWRTTLWMQSASAMVP